LIGNMLFAELNVPFGLRQMSKLHRAIHAHLPCNAGGSAMGLSATDAHGQSVGR
jgi:hypothetical protein